MAGGELRFVAENATSRQKNYAVRAGTAIGGLVSACYLVATDGRREIGGRVLPSDPVWVQFVNVALIFFAAIFTASSLRKGLCRLLAWRKRG